MLNWHKEAEELLNKQDYQGLANYYEELVENEPDEINHYWYLGLAYLLTGKEEEAQATWFIPFNYAEENQADLWIQDLSSILITEATKFEQQKDEEKLWLIRNSIREIDPDNLDNCLKLLSISFSLKIFEVNFLEDWNIIELLKNNLWTENNLELLSYVLDQILQLKLEESIYFAESILIYTNKNITILNQIRKTASMFALDFGLFYYAIDLILLCTKYALDNFYDYVELFFFYIHIKNYHKVRETLAILKTKAKSFEEEILYQNHQYRFSLILGEWDIIYDLGEKQIQSYQKIIESQYIFQNPNLKDKFITNLLNLLYIKDDLIHHRYLFNKISDLYCKSNKTEQKIIYTQSKEIRPLKIGYLGSTFKTHSVGFLARWLIKHHNPELFEVNIYSVSGHQDKITHTWFIPNNSNMTVKKFYDGKRSVNGTVNQIKQDQIDILIDLDSITFNLTNLVLLRKPAPIQATWLGADASGLTTIDYFIADSYVLPEDAENYYREKIWRLPNTYLALDGFEIGVPTIRREDLGIDKDSVVFMNLQNPAKLNPQIITLQLKIIKSISNSYLITKIRKDEKTLKKLIGEISQDLDISLNQLRFIPYDPTEETHRANLTIADVVLDTYPYNGSTTTLEALWAEIPVITRVGEQFAARNSYTYMMNAGITEGIAWSDEEYIEWGIKLGTDENLRKKISWKLKQSKKTSPLWNGKQFAREMEKAYRQMWEIYIKENS